MDETSINRKFWIVIVITIVLLLGIGVAFYFFHSAHSANVAEHTLELGKVDKLQKKVASLQEMKRAMERDEGVAATYEAFLPSQENIPNMLTAITNEATKKNLIFKSASVSFPTSSKSKKGKPDIYRTGVFKLQLIGQSPDVIDFINVVERSDRFLMVNDVSLSPTSSNPKMSKDNWVDPLNSPYLDFSILIYTFIYTGG